MLDLSPMQNSQKMERVNVSFSAVEHPHSPLHEAVKDTKRCRLEWGKSSMGPSEDSVLQVSQLTESSSKPRSGKGTHTDSGTSETLLAKTTWEGSV